MCSIDNSFIMSEDCKTMYVLPPVHGNSRITAAGYVGVAAEQQCRTLDFYGELLKCFKFLT